MSKSLHLTKCRGVQWDWGTVCPQKKKKNMWGEKKTANLLTKDCIGYVMAPYDAFTTFLHSSSVSCIQQTEIAVLEDAKKKQQNQEQEPHVVGDLRCFEC